MSDITKRDFNGIAIAFEGKEKVSLTDLWKAAGSPENKQPTQWVRWPQTQEFIKSLAQKLNVCNTHNAIIQAKRGGKTPGTWAHWQLALTYAQMLSPELHMFVNQCFVERVQEENNPELAITRGRERAVNAWKRQGKTDEWIESRLKGISTRKKFTSVLAVHGVKGKGFGKCTNAIYEPMLGDTAAVVKAERGLKPNANLRDNVGNIENIGIMLAEALASEKIDGRNYHGDDQCSSACFMSSSTVAKAIKESRKAM